jgi:Asp-tRNA(Asn)/Glu-tRNA(Gln) amidotransferase B subunit
MLCVNRTGINLESVVENPRINEVAEAVKAFEGHRSTLEMLDAFRY